MKSRYQHVAAGMYPYSGQRSKILSDDVVRTRKISLHVVHMHTHKRALSAAASSVHDHKRQDEEPN
jgi:hypothetical protein